MANGGAARRETSAEADRLKRVVVVPWDEVVRFEVRPVHVPNMSEVGATISLVGAAVLPTPVKLARDWRFDVNAYHVNYDVVLDEAEFFRAVDRLNKAIDERARPPLG